MTMLLLTGIVLLFVPLALMFGFGAVIFFSFTNDDPGAKRVVQLMFVVMGVGLLLIAGHFMGVYFG